MYYCGEGWLIRAGPARWDDDGKHERDEIYAVIGGSGLLALVMMCYILRRQGKYST